MESIKKLNDPITEQMYEYVVVGYSDPINSKYGLNYILLVSDQISTERFKMWTTNLLAEYISNKKPKEKFMFVVNERNGMKYPLIENYKKERTLIC